MKRRWLDTFYSWICTLIIVSMHVGIASVYLALVDDTVNITTQFLRSSLTDDFFPTFLLHTNVISILQMNCRLKAVYNTAAICEYHQDFNIYMVYSCITIHSARNVDIFALFSPSNSAYIAIIILINIVLYLNRWYLHFISISNVYLSRFDYWIRPHIFIFPFHFLRPSSHS